MQITKKTRTHAAFALLAAAIGSGIALAADAIRDADVRAAEEAARKSLGLVSTESDGFRYEYHAPSGRERLFDLRRDPKCLNDVSPVYPDRVREYRSRLATKLGVTSLDELRAPYAETIRRLELMGYF